MFLITNRWKAIKTQYFAEIKCLCFSYSHWPLDTKHLLSNRRAVFWGHISTGCFEKSSEWLSATEEGSFFLFAFMVEFLKIIFLPERHTYQKFSHSGPHAACGPYTVYTCCSGSKLVPFWLLTYLLTYLLHGAVLLDKLTVTQLANKFPAFYGTRSFITAFTTARQLYLSWAR